MILAASSLPMSQLSTQAEVFRKTQMPLGIAAYFSRIMNHHVLVRLSPASYYLLYSSGPDCTPPS
ncbi:unnamed protein product [Fusarium graminearum]|uniref:Uncharacterized protein n=1 Tax=Gibberella zeae (strain ATCC MYA-4620 / CBS 123657 / FGSC 9075 / NRRL 31084 / PH-1) TaxID=229533 RepID=A0A098D8R5_GIBZE|nr:unnamed protein product [Fusarium graminearum]